VGLVCGRGTTPVLPLTSLSLQPSGGRPRQMNSLNTDDRPRCSEWSVFWSATTASISDPMLQWTNRLTWCTKNTISIRFDFQLKKRFRFRFRWSYIRNISSICEAYRRAGLVVNVKKTEVLPQASQQHISALPPFTINNAPLCTVQQFTYLGSILSADCDITNEVNQRIKLAICRFWPALSSCILQSQPDHLDQSRRL